MTILAATDLSDNSRAALRSAARLARLDSEDLAVLFCDEASAPDATWRWLVQTPWEDKDELREEARSQLRTFVEDSLPDTGELPGLELRVEFAPIDEGASSLAAELDADLLVCGATGAGAVGRVVFGSSAEKLVRTQQIPVLTVPEAHELAEVEEVLAPVDTSECSRLSLEWAADFARRHDAHLDVLRAVSAPTELAAPYQEAAPPVDEEEYRNRLRDELETFVDESDTADAALSTYLVHRPPYRAIVEFADEHDSDAIVMGTHGRRGFERLLLGSTTTKVLRDIPAPVVTLHHREDTSEPG